MTLRDDILANPDCAAAVAARDLDAIAAIMSAGRVAVQPRFITARTILAECGAAGAGILDALTAASSVSSAVKWALTFLSQDSGLDVGNAVTQGMIDQLAGIGALTADQATALKDLALQSAPVSRLEVEAALFKDAQ